jgi:hypothetical protein
MKKKLFTDQEREKLDNNPYVKSVSKVSVFYTQEFKEKAVFEHSRGKTAKQIFIDAGINLDVVGERSPIDCLSEWRKNDRMRNQSYRDLIQAQAKIAYLEAENELLKKLEALEKEYR